MPQFPALLVVPPESTCMLCLLVFVNTCQTGECLKLASIAGKKGVGLGEEENSGKKQHIRLLRRLV